MVRHGRSRGGRGTAVVVLLVVVAVCLVAQPSVGEALDRCEDDRPVPGTASHDLAIVQTSIITGLAPAVPPAAITGTVTNLSRDSTYVSHVTVRISSVTKAAGAPAGRCSPDDYLLLNPRMLVDLPLPALSSIGFFGAALGFDNSSRNQDACKGATVRLVYVSSSR